MMEEGLLTRQQIRSRMRLPWSMVIKIAMASFQHRRMRTSITILSLSLAIAFLTYTTVCSDLAHAFRSTAQKHLIFKLDHMGYDMEPSPNGQINPRTKLIWIAVLSLLVCVIGIINTQLMSVMEQYRDIGTMKCLGALDSVILRILATEALIQGLVGSLGGIVAGLIFALIHFQIYFGLTLYEIIDPLSVLLRIGISLVVGCTLSFIGVAYPAVIVARMQPTEALRVER
jgi:putative ABC transport system permease protein